MRKTVELMLDAVQPAQDLVLEVVGMVTGFTHEIDNTPKPAWAGCAIGNRWDLSPL